MVKTNVRKHTRKVNGERVEVKEHARKINYRKPLQTIRTSPPKTTFEAMEIFIINDNNIVGRHIIEDSHGYLCGKLKTIPLQKDTKGNRYFIYNGKKLFL